MIHLKLLIGVVLMVVSLAANAGPGAESQRKAVEVAQSMVKQLSAVMKEKMQSQGPVGAIEACSVDALRIASELSRETGWQVKRVGTKVRNSLIGMPDAWEHEILRSFEKKLAEGASIERLAYGKLILESGHRYYRFMKAMPVKSQCLTCHGDVDKMPSEVREVISLNYPHDKAVGYKAGELRGAISIKIPL